MKGKYLIFLNYIYLTFIFIWHSLQVTILEGFDGKGRLSIISSMVILIINLVSSKGFLKSFYGKKSILKIWLLWFLYAIINTLFQYNGNDISLSSFIGQSLFVPFIVMSIIANISKIEIKIFLQYMQYIVYISVLFLFLFAKNIEGRLEVELFDPNELSLLINLLVVILSVRFIRNEINLLSFFLLMILPIYYIIFSGSRMAFGSFLILIIGLVFSFKEKMGFTLILKYLFIFLAISLVTFYVLENTVLGERLLSTTEQSAESFINPAEGTIFEHYGDRGVYYILGWDLFLKHSIFGIGLRNFIEYFPTVNHVEFMIQITELGIIGLTLYVIFNGMIFKNIFIKRKNALKKQKSLYNYLLFVFGSILFSASVLFLYSSIAIAALYGLLILFIKEHNMKNIKICTN